MQPDMSRLRNGEEGLLGVFDEATGRWDVYVGDEVHCLRPENLLQADVKSLSMLQRFVEPCREILVDVAEVRSWAVPSSEFLVDVAEAHIMPPYVEIIGDMAEVRSWDVPSREFLVGVAEARFMAPWVEIIGNMAEAVGNLLPDGWS
eukprot:gb/GFBE01063439.1/.p1 GENE.gb/GFBE01063439.1/~~gb/GFBE01063439.1/.p1  ORF type:complete len:147 (+),score=38.79 gb/GFBE01063439.1/:1-441(+)